MTQNENARYAAVLAQAAELGIPIRKEVSGNRVAVLHDIRDGRPLYRVTLNANAAISSGAKQIQAAPYSLNGSGIKVGVWDGGWVRGTHQELTDRVTVRDSGESGAALDDHATHVAGTIGATGVQASAKGMAPSVMIDTYYWTNDYTEMTAAGAVASGDTTGIPISNHSYGITASTTDMGRYETHASDLDAVAASLPYYLPFWAAGNEQDVLTSLGGFQSITFDALAKNILTVGATDDAVTSGARDPSKAIIAYFSSLGPCDDGRIKPDVVANGMGLYSSISTSDTSYASYSGTSMATPSAAGSAALLAQLYAQQFSGHRMRASMLKGLLIHTADDRGNAGPDYTYGWGLINVKAAADLIRDHQASLGSPKMIEGNVTATSTLKTHSFTWDGTSPIRATLCWTDPAGTAQIAADSRTPNLKHNLDLRITAPDGTTVYQPYIMPFVGTWTQASMSSPATTGDNNVDNVEQVYLASPTQSGTYTVSVTLDGSLTTSEQAYSLIVSGGVSVEANPPPTVSITSPASGSTVQLVNSVLITATASDLALGSVPGAVASVEFFANGVSIGVDSAPPYEVTWTPVDPGDYSLTAQATDTEGASMVSTIVPVSVQTLFYEDFSSITLGNNTSFNGSGTAWAGNSNFPTVVKAYQAGGAVRLGSSSGAGSMTSRTIDLSANGGNYTIRFKVKGWTTVEGNIKVTVTGLTPQTASYTSIMSGSFETKSLRFSGCTASSTVKIETTAKRAYIDDVVVTPTPIITASGTLDAVSTSYGSASPSPASFTVSGTNMLAGILVTPPSGFEVSQTAGGTSGYADVQTIGSGGTIANTTLYLRLKAGIAAGTYSGNVSCTSSGAETVTRATIASAVQPAALVIKADDLSKAFGTTLALGAGQTAFTSSGLVLGETVGTVTLAASGGLAPYDAVGTYDLTPSAVTGGTFNPANYDISYQESILTVTGKTFGDWTAEKPALGGATGPNDDFEPDGLPNLVEYFMGLDPTVADVGTLVPTAKPGEFSIRYRRNKNQQGVVGGIVWKSNLLDAREWSNVGVVDTVAEDHGDYEIREAKITITPGGDVRFMRLRVIQN